MPQFRVLSDPQKRAVYDNQNPEAGLKGQVPMPPRGAGSVRPNMNRSNRPSPYNIFRNRSFRRRGAGSANMYGSNRRPSPLPSDIFQEHFGSSR
ncbi:hypothetical protein AgCh_011137 [Apium graveolens]